MDGVYSNRNQGRVYDIAAHTGSFPEIAGRLLQSKNYADFANTRLPAAPGLAGWKPVWHFTTYQLL